MNILSFPVEALHVLIKFQAELASICRARSLKNSPRH